MKEFTGITTIKNLPTGDYRDRAPILKLRRVYFDIDDAVSIVDDDVREELKKLRPYTVGSKKISLTIIPDSGFWAKRKTQLLVEVEYGTNGAPEGRDQTSW